MKKKISQQPRCGLCGLCGILEVPRTAKKIMKENVSKGAYTESDLLDRIRTQQAKFAGHVMRRHSLGQIFTS